MSENHSSGDPGDRVVRIVVIAMAVVFLLGCASMIGLFAICTSM